MNPPPPPPMQVIRIPLFPRSIIRCQILSVIELSSSEESGRNRMHTMPLIQNQLRMCLCFSSTQTRVRVMNTEFGILLTLRKGRGRTEMGCQSEGNCTLDAFLLQMSQRGGIFSWGKLTSGHATVQCMPCFSVCLSCVHLLNLQPLQTPWPHCFSLLEAEIMSVLDGVQMAGQCIVLVMQPLSTTRKNGGGGGGAHFTLPPSPKLTAAVKNCPVLKDCHLKSSSAGPAAWLCSTLRLCAFTETLKLTLEGTLGWCSSVQELLCSATIIAWVQGSAVTFSQC